ncbi:MAG: hypothetical protein JNG88_09695 [Phycisphaerales bacterium]|nr:hypothetical protein [Phycisphaerales bacterium]
MLCDEAGLYSSVKLHDRLGRLAGVATYTLRVRASGEGWHAARMSVASAALAIRAPRQARGAHSKEALFLSGVIARDIDAPPGETPLE